MHAEAVRSHKNRRAPRTLPLAYLARRPDSNICTQVRLMQPYFFGFREILLSVLSVPGFPDGVKLAPNIVWRKNSICFRCGRPHSSRKSSGIDYVADARQGLEVQFVTGDFDQHERSIGVESTVLYGGSFQITRAQFTR